MEIVLQKSELFKQELLNQNEIILDRHSDLNSIFHFERFRLNQLLAEAVKYPLILVCAGTGYGKTSTIHDFSLKYQSTWIQLSDSDNVNEHFWENYINCIERVNMQESKTIGKIGFPDTREKQNRYQTIMNNFVGFEKRIIVFDNFQFLRNPSVIRFVEECILFETPPETSIIIISRSTLNFYADDLVSKGLMFTISENDLRFNDNELTNYFNRLNIFLSPENHHEIMKDTAGWAFAINLIARSYQRAPGYVGYLQNAMKLSVFKQMETEIWGRISINIQFFLIKRSLIDHFSFDLINLMIGKDENLIAELEDQNAYVRRDNNINAYLINPLFLEFLSTKQGLLSDEQKGEAYIIAGDWCKRNGFKIDALSYYEKLGDYSSIVSIFCELSVHIPHDIAKHTSEILDRAPEIIFETVEFLAITHIRSCIRQGLWKRSLELLKFYESKFISMPEKDIFRNRNLNALYLCWGNLRNYICVTDNKYDFDIYFGKFKKRYIDPADLGKLAIRSLGTWINAVGSSRKGSPERYIYAISRASSHLSGSFGEFMAGEDDLARGEHMFFKGDLRVAEHYVTRALGRAREYRQFEVANRALLYILRICFAQGNYEKVEQAVKDARALTDEFPICYVDHDVFLSLYYCLLGIPQQVPGWIKQNFLPYGHAGFIENFHNQAKVRFCYATRNYTPLLNHIHEMKQRESYLFGRVEMLAMEACVHYRMKEKTKAFAALLEAYMTASPNDLVMPFIELGKDMRTLTASAMKESNNSIPVLWLDSINRKAASYAKRQANVTWKYKQASHISDGIALSPRESEVLTDLSQGLSRVEIAASRGLSINTIKMIINTIYTKFGAENLADLIRMAVERKMV